MKSYAQRWPLFLTAALVLVAIVIAAAALRAPAPAETPVPPTRAVLADTPSIGADLPDRPAPESSPPQADAPAPLPTVTLPAETQAEIAPAPAGEARTLAVPQEPVPGQAVITFAPDASLAERAAYLDSIGATVRQEIGPLHAVVISLPPETAAGSLPPSAVVAASEPDYLVTALQSAPVSDPLYPQQWALPVIGAPAAWAALPADAAPVTVAVIDSGICADHPDLAGRVLPGWDFVENDADPQDPFGHGCSVAGVIAANHDGLGMAGVAPNARILPLRVLDAQGVGTYSSVAAAIIQAADQGAPIINLSLGGASPSAVMENAVDYAVARGAMLIAAAGNTSGSVLYPAAYTPVVAVASVDQNLQRSSFSSYGPEIDLSAPGRDIVATRPGGGYGSVSGTSFAAPQVAGVAALELALGRQLALTGGLVAVGGGTGVVIQPTPIPPDAPDDTLPDSAWPGGQRPPLRVMVPHPDVAAQMAAEATSLGQLFPQMALTGGLEPGPRMVFPQNQTFRLLALLVEFSDFPRNAGIAVTSFDTILFSNAPGANTVRNYYRETSYNQLDIVSVTLPSAIGWRTAPQPRSYYTNNLYCLGTASFPFSYPNNCQRLVEDLVWAVNPVVDFSQYDNNGDGWVDTLVVIHAGRGAETTGQPSDIWSHQWSTRVPPLVDGVRVGNYTMQPEYVFTPGDLTIGTLVHELGHAFGLPDLYDIDYTSYGVGNWSLMSSGSWNGPSGNGASPAHLDAWSKAWLGFTTPTVLTATQAITLPAAVNNPTAYRINTSRPGEYFLIENRQKVGYDFYLPGAGLLIWHVDEAVAGSNRYECRQHNNWLCGAYHFRVALEQADGFLDLENKFNRGDSGDPFPGILARRAFGPATLPNTSSYYTSAPQYFGLFEISNPGMTMTAQFRVMVPTPALSAPANGAEVSTQQPTLSWLPVAGADAYDVQIGPADPPLAAPVRVTTSSYTPPLLDLGVTYYWRVRALDAAGNLSEWSATRSVRAASPPNVAPARNRFTTDQPLLTWGRVTDALAYQVQVARVPSFAGAVTYDAGSALQWPISAPDEGLYFWRVRAQMNSGAWGPWSAPDSFTVDLP